MTSRRPSRVVAIEWIVLVVGCSAQIVTTSPGGGTAPGESADVRNWPGESIGSGTLAPFQAGDGDGVRVGPDGSLTLDGEQTAILHTWIWVANSWEGTVSKIDTRTHKELGRYRTGPVDSIDPSRTAVDRDGNVVVANRGISSATHVLAGGCPDRNNDGRVQTSTSGGDVLDWGQDECVAWHTAVGARDAVARGTVVESRGGLDGVFERFAWVGAFEEQKVYEIRMADGVLTGRRVSMAPTFPYGAALGPGGKVWVASDEGLASFDTTTLEVTQHPVPLDRWNYGITVDREGDVWMGGSVQRFRPSTGLWDWPDAGPAGEFVAGGVAADASGFIWAGLGLEGRGILRIDSRTLEATRIETGGREHGIAIDADGFVWGIDIEGDAATILDPGTLGFERFAPPFVGAYSYSDMTGFQTANALHDGGAYRHVFEGCPDTPTAWGELRWDVRTPAGSRVTFTVRTGDDLSSIEQSAATAVAAAPGDVSPMDLSAALGPSSSEMRRFLEVELGLYSDDGTHAPSVLAVGVAHSCLGFIE